MTPLLDKPATVNRRAECLYLYAPGEVCVNVESGTTEDRARVMALLEQVQRMASLVTEISSTACELETSLTQDDCAATSLPYDARCGTCQARAVLRAAGVLDE